jgi:hypothetical protein
MGAQDLTNRFAHGFLVSPLGDPDSKARRCIVGTIYIGAFDTRNAQEIILQ